jgi:hypothetical protein
VSWHVAACHGMPRRTSTHRATTVPMMTVWSSRHGSFP